MTRRHEPNTTGRTTRTQPDHNEPIASSTQSDSATSGKRQADSSRTNHSSTNQSSATSGTKGRAGSDGRDGRDGQRRGSARGRSETTGDVPARRPRINLDNKQLRDLSEEALSALLRAHQQDPRLFVSAGHLVLLERDAATGTATPLPVDVHVLRGELTRAADFFEKRGRTVRAAYPPRDVVYDLLARATWPFSRLKGVVGAPVMRPDGTILDTVGYDQATGLYYAPATEDTSQIQHVPERPTPAEVRQAAAWRRMSHRCLPSPSQPRFPCRRSSGENRAI